MRDGRGVVVTDVKDHQQDLQLLLFRLRELEALLEHLQVLELFGVVHQSLFHYLLYFVIDAFFTLKLRGST